MSKVSKMLPPLSQLKNKGVEILGEPVRKITVNLFQNGGMNVENFPMDHKACIRIFATAAEACVDHIVRRLVGVPESGKADDVEIQEEPPREHIPVDGDAAPEQEEENIAG